MHDFLVGGLFVLMVLAPCLVAHFSESTPFRFGWRKAKTAAAARTPRA